MKGIHRKQLSSTGKSNVKVFGTSPKLKVKRGARKLTSPTKVSRVKPI